MARILVVDDEESIRSFITDVLELDNHDVIQAEDGQRACEMFYDSPIDLIVTDLVMPEKNGIQMILELKKKQPDVKVVAISGGSGFSGNIDLLTVAKLIGAKHIIKKPFDLDEIRNVVKELLEN